MTVEKTALSPAKMKLLLLCLGLTLVCAQEGNSDVVRSNFDIPEVRAGKHSDFGFWRAFWKILKQGGNL